jgi:hypothetical protein
MLQPRRRREQFGAAQGPHIDEVSPETFAHTADPFTVTGRRFGATQGGSALKIANNENLGAAGIVRNCGIVNWSDEELSAYAPSLSGLPSTSYLFVVTAAGTSNAYPVTIG